MNQTANNSAQCAWWKAAQNRLDQHQQAKSEKTQHEKMIEWIMINREIAKKIDSDSGYNWRTDYPIPR